MNGLDIDSNLCNGSSCTNYTRKNKNMSLITNMQYIDNLFPFDVSIEEFEYKTHTSDMKLKWKNETNKTLKLNWVSASNYY